LLAFDAARAGGGRFLLRIEDIDQGRCRPHFEAAIYEDLAWLGLVWEQPVRRQSACMADYAQALERLHAKGVLCRCFRTRKELAEASASAPHGREAASAFGPLPEAEEGARLARDEAFAWRLSMAKARAALGAAFDALTFEDETGLVAAEPARHGDVVLARKDFPTSYHLASVLDDALQGVTLVVRGEDLREAAHLHVLLQRLLDLPTPRYHHHRLLLGADGKRLAKRNGAPSLAALRRDNMTAKLVRERLGLPPVDKPRAL
jgi:glutamyl-Q tRNA(Asp) synthetase